MLYALWDLGLKVGHSSRSLDEMVRQAKGDITVRTALLEARYVCGDTRALRRGGAPLQGRGPARHRARSSSPTSSPSATRATARWATRRYVVEPNVKEGKGGLRDLHALFWIGKYVYDVQRAAELVDVGLFTKAEYRQFHRADNFLLGGALPPPHASPAAPRTG